MATKVSKVVFEQSVEKAQLDGTLDENYLARMEKAKESRKAAKKQKDNELLFKWIPGAQKKPISNKFDHMMKRFMDPKLRKMSKTVAKKEEHNAKY